MYVYNTGENYSSKNGHLGRAFLIFPLSQIKVMYHISKISRSYRTLFMHLSPFKYKRISLINSVMNFYL